jgi:hypothetical protein
MRFLAASPRAVPQECAPAATLRRSVRSAWPPGSQTEAVAEHTGAEPRLPRQGAVAIARSLATRERMPMTLAADTMSAADISNRKARSQEAVPSTIAR